MTNRTGRIETPERGARKLMRYNIALRVAVKAGQDLHPQEVERALVAHLHARLRGNLLKGTSGDLPSIEGDDPDTTFEIVGVMAQPDIYTMIGTTRVKAGS